MGPGLGAKFGSGSRLDVKTPKGKKADAEIHATFLLVVFPLAENPPTKKNNQKSALRNVFPIDFLVFCSFGP